VFLSRFMPCRECGASLERSTPEVHECDPERLAEYRMFAMRGRIAAFESHLHRFLATPTGRFETWLAARHVRRHDR